MSLKTIVAEDVPATRRDIVAGLHSDPNFEVIFDAEDVESLFGFIQEEWEIDVLFLDLKLIGGTAFDLLQRMREGHIEIPPVVLITGNARPEYMEQTVNQFRREIVHYLEKPIMDKWEEKRENCLTAIRKRKKELRQDTLSFNSEKMLVRDNNRIYPISFSDIQCIQVNPNKEGVLLHIVNQRNPIQEKTSLKGMFEKLPKEDFVMVSRQAIVNKNQVDYIEQAMPDARRSPDDPREPERFYAFLMPPSRMPVLLSENGKKRLERALLQ